MLIIVSVLIHQRDAEYLVSSSDRAKYQSLRTPLHYLQDIFICLFIVAFPRDFLIILYATYCMISACAKCSFRRGRVLVLRTRECYFPKSSSCHTHVTAIRHKCDECRLGFHTRQSETILNSRCLFNPDHTS